MSFDFDGNGTIRSDGRIVGYIKDDAVYTGNYAGSGGQCVGYIKGDAIYTGHYAGSGGQCVGYIKDDSVYAGSYPDSGGKLVASTTTPHPRWNAAAYFLLT